MPKQRERWIAAHQAMGHHPHPAPTKENPEQWECKCDPDAVWTAVWRISELIDPLWGATSRRTFQ